MLTGQVLIILAGILFLGLAVANYQGRDHKYIVSNIIREQLSNDERVCYQKELALPTAIAGILTILVSIFLWEKPVIMFIGIILAFASYIIGALRANKKYFGEYFVNTRE